MKGFVYTLEAIIASTIVLTTVILVFPDVSSDESFDTGELRQEVKNLDKRNNLSSDNSGVKKQLEEEISSGFNLSVRQVETDTVAREEIGQNYTLSNDVYHNLMIWVDSSTDLTVEYRGEVIVDSFDGSGYIERGITGTGDLNFTGSGDGRWRVIEYPAEGSLDQRETAFTVNYITDLDNSAREVRLRAWK